MVTGYNFKSLIESINVELLDMKASSQPLQVEQVITDLYSKLVGIRGYEFNKALTPQSFTFYADTDKQAIWQINVQDMVANTYTFLSSNTDQYYFTGVQTTSTDVISSLDTMEEYYPKSFTVKGTTLYLTVPNTGITATEYIEWIPDAATLTESTDYFTNIAPKLWYHVQDTPTLTITAPTVVVNSIVANTLHANVTNDLAENRLVTEPIQFGYVVENDGEKVKLCENDRSKMAIGIVSDTTKFTIGNKENSVPIAIAGRVLAYYEGELKPGDLVCSTKNGKVRKMSWFEKILYPETILGKVIDIPKEYKWNDVIIDNRAWIQL